MKRVLLAVVMFVCAVPSFAQESFVLGEKAVYLMLDNNFYAARKHELIDFMGEEDTYYSADGGTYNVGVTAGYNVYQNMNIEGSLSFIPSDEAVADGLFDVMFIIQDPFIKGGSGFMPYYGVGLGLKWGSKDEELRASTRNYYANLNYDVSFFGVGVVSKAGIRYYDGPFLIGLGAELGLYSISRTETLNGDANTPSTGYVYFDGSKTKTDTDFTFKVGFSVGFMF